MGTGFDILLAEIMIFGAVFLLVVGIKTLMAGAGETDIEINKLPPVYKMFWGETKYFSRLAGSSLAVQSPARTNEYRTTIMLADLKLEPADIYGSQAMWAMLLGVVGAVMAFACTTELVYIIPSGLVGAFIGWVYPYVCVQKIASERQEKIARSLPFAVDLITSAMQAGLDFTAAVRYYVNNNKEGPLSQEFGVTLKHMELGKARVESLRSMSERIQIEEFKSLVSAVAQGAEMGAAIVETLRITAEEMRRARFARAERKAQRAPSLMLIPMALFIMPSVFIIIFTPVYLRVKDSGFSSMF